MISKAQGSEPIKVLESTTTEQPKISTTESGKLIIDTLSDFKIKANYIDSQCGPTFNRIKIKLGKGVSFKKIQDFGNDFVQQLGDKLNMETPPMVSVIPGGAAIDIPRTDREIVYFKDYVDFLSPLDIHNIVIPGGVGVDGNYVDIPLFDENVTHILGGGYLLHLIFFYNNNNEILLILFTVLYNFILYYLHNEHNDESSKGMFPRFKPYCLDGGR